MQIQFKKILKWVLYYPLLVVICLELALLILGYRRYQYIPFTVKAVPENAFIGNDSMGIALNEGQYQITLNDAVQFEAKHTKDGKRFTTNQPKNYKSKIALLGCSFTYGYGINDDQTFASHVQRLNPNYFIDNYGVIGYGTVQSYLQLQQILQDSTNKLVLLNFSSFHFVRNVLSEAYRENLKIGYAQSSGSADNLMKLAKFPYIADSSCKVKFENWDQMHNNWPGRELFACVNWIQTTSERYRDKALNEVVLTAHLILKMNKMCLDKNVKFGVVCLDQNDKTAELQKLVAGVAWHGIGFDFNDSKLTLQPHDSHPNSNGHREIAKRIQPFLDKILNHE